MDDIKDKLLDFQVKHVRDLQSAIKSNLCVVDASDTGTGKTYCALALCKLEKLTPLVICPKSVISSWMSVAKIMDVEMLGVSNYELIKGCKFYDKDMNIVDCGFIDKYIMSNKEIELLKLSSKSKKINKESYMCQFPKDTVVIFDEAHRCKNHKTINSRFLISVAESRTKIMLLSATIIDKIECFKPFGVVFGLYDDKKKYLLWMKAQLKLVKERNKLLNKEKDNTDIRALQLHIIHKTMFPYRGSRMKISELGEKFPKNQIMANCYYSDNHDEINKLYDVINTALKELKNRETRAEGLGKLIIARVKIEVFKVPIIIDLCQEALDNDNSVAIFVNFKEAMNMIALHFDCDCLVHGEQTLEERNYAIERFQKNESKIIICIIQAGGVGISLHDLHGRPRMSIISPSWTAQDMVQAFGRIHRAGAKTPSIQKIVYIAKTYEEDVCKLMKEKIENINTINNGILLPFEIDTENLQVLEQELKPEDIKITLERKIEVNQNVELEEDLEEEKPKVKNKKINKYVKINKPLS
uniref:Helicase n=1 Tax=viral metagenome TaxID=1070528 RepID=A0A6C0EC08_9ZZZZ